MHQRESADMVGVGVGEEDGVQRTALLNLGEVGELVSVSGTHADARVDEDAPTGDFEQSAGGADFMSAAEEGEPHGLDLCSSQADFLSKVRLPATCSR